MLSYEREVSSKLLRSLVSQLPFRSGKSLDKNAGLCGKFHSFIISLAQWGDQDFVIGLLLDLIEEAIDETDFAFALHEPLENSHGVLPSVSASDEQYITASAESLILLVNLLSLALVLDTINTDSGSNPSRAAEQLKELKERYVQYDSDFYSYFMSILRRSKPQMSEPIALRCIKTLMPIMTPKSLLGFLEIPFGGMSMADQQKRILLFSTTGVLAFVAFACPNVLNDQMDALTRQTFDSSHHFRVPRDVYPEGLTLQFMNPQLGHKAFARIIQVYPSIRNAKQRQMLLFVTLNAIQRSSFFVPEYAPGWTDESLKLAKVLLGLLEVTKPDENLAEKAVKSALMVCMALRSSTSDYTHPDFTRLWASTSQTYSGWLRSDDQARARNGYAFFQEVARFVYIVNLRADTKLDIGWDVLNYIRALAPFMAKQSQFLVDERPVTGLTHREMSTSLSMNSFGSGSGAQFSIINTSPGSPPPAPERFHLYFGAVFDSMELGDPDLWNGFDTWSSDFVSAISACCVCAATPGPLAARYSDVFIAGCNLLPRTRHLLSLLSNAQKTQLINTMYAKLDALDNAARDKVMEVLVHSFTIVEETSFEALRDVYDILTEVVYAQVPKLMDPASSRLHWDMDYLHRLLRSRVKVTSRLAPLLGYPKTYNFDEESRLRCAVLLALCDTHFETSELALDSIRILADEMLLLTNAGSHDDHYCQRSNDVDFEIFRAMLGRESKRMRSTVQLLTGIHQEMHSISGTSKTVKMLFKTVDRFLQYFQSYYDPVKKFPADEITLLKKVCIHLTLVRDISTHALLNSSNEADRNIVLSGHVRHYEALRGMQSFFRTISIEACRSRVIDRPEVAALVLNYVFTNLFVPVSTAEYSDEQIQRQSATDLIAISIYLPKTIEMCVSSERVRLDFDICAGVESIVRFAEPYVFAGFDALLSKNLLRLIEVTARAENLYKRPKAVGMKHILQFLLKFLAHFEPGKNDEGISLPATRAVSAVLNGFSVDVISLLSKQDFEAELEWMGETILALQEVSNKIALCPEDSEQHLHGALRLNQESISAFIRSNLELGFILSSRREFQSEHLRVAFIDAFGESCADQLVQFGDESSRYSHMSEILTKHIEITAAMCEICPVNEVDTLAFDVTNFFCANGRALDLAQMAITKEIDQARDEVDLFRRNSVTVKILVNLVNICARDQIFEACEPAVREVIRSPLQYMPLESGVACSTAAVRLLTEMAGRLSGGKGRPTPNSLIVLIKLVTVGIQSKYPGSNLTGLRNLFLLRLICPLIVAPGEFGLIKGTVSNTALRALLNVAKIVQRIDVSPTSADGEDDVAGMFRAILVHLRDSEPTATDVDSLAAEFQPVGNLSKVQRSLHRYLSRHGPEIPAYLAASELREEKRAAASRQGPFYLPRMTTTSSSSSESSQASSFNVPAAASISGSSSASTPESAGFDTFSPLESSTAAARVSAFTPSEPVSMIAGRLIRKLGSPIAFSDEIEDGSISKVARGLTNMSIEQSSMGDQWVQNEGFRAEIFEVKGVRTVLLSRSGKELLQSDVSGRLVVHRLYRALQSAVNVQRETLDLIVDFSFPFLTPAGWHETLQTLISAAPGESITKNLSLRGYCPPANYVLASSALPLSHGFFQLEAPCIYLTVGDLDESELLDLGFSGETINVYRDYVNATKYANVPLTLAAGGSLHTTEVYVGKSFVIVKAEHKLRNGIIAKSSDIFPFGCVTVGAGQIELKGCDPTYNSGFIFRREDEPNMYRKIWDIHSRQQGAIFQDLSVIEFSPYITAAKLLFLCLSSLCSSDSLSLRESAFRLLVALPSRFNLKVGPQFPGDMQLQLSIVQIVRVVKISRAYAEAHPEFTMPIVKSFIELIGGQKNPRMQVVYVRVMEPWVANLTQALESSETQKARAEVSGLVHSLLRLLSHDGSLKEVITSHVWPSILAQERIFPLVVNVWVQFAVEEVFKKRKGFSNPYSAIFASPIPVYGVRHLFDRLYYTLDMQVSYKVTTWTRHPNWVSIEVVMLLLANAILSSSREISNFMADFSFVIIAFGGIGPLNFRKGVHNLVVNVLNKLLVSADFDQSNVARVRSLLRSIKSAKGEVMFGIQVGVHDDAYDGYNQFSGADVAEMASFVAEITYVVVPSSDLRRVREDTLNLLTRYADKTYPALQRKCILGLQGIMSAKMPDSVISRLLELQGHILRTCKNIEMVHSYTNAILIALSDRISAVNEASAYPQRLTWLALSMLSLRIRSVANAALVLLESCVRCLEIRSPGKSLSGIILDGQPPEIVVWWKRNSSALLSLPHQKNLQSAMSELFVSSFQHTDTSPATLAVCERLVEADSRLTGTSDSSKLGSLSFKILLYLCTRDLSHLRSLSTPTHIFGVDDDRLMDELRGELASLIDYDDDTSIVALIDACQITGFSASMSLMNSGPRLLDLVCSLEDRSLIRLVAPLLRPTMNHLLAVDDPELNTKLVNWTQVLFAQDRFETNGMSKQLSRAEEALHRLGRSPAITKEFRLVKNHASAAVDQPLSIAMIDLYELMRFA